MAGSKKADELIVSLKWKTLFREESKPKLSKRKIIFVETVYVLIVSVLK